MTRILKLYEMAHPLKDALTQSDLLIAQYTSEDIEAYEKEWNEMNIHRTADKDICQESRVALSEEVEFYFGQYSKEDKYFDRSMRNGESKPLQ